MIQKLLQWANKASMVFSWFGHTLIAGLIYMPLHLFMWWLLSLVVPVDVLLWATISTASTYDGREFGAIGDSAIGRISGGGIKALFRKPVWHFESNEGNPLLRFDNIGDFMVPKVLVLVVYGWLLGWVW